VKGPGASTYLVDSMNHHGSGYPYRDVGGGHRASTLPRKIHHGPPIEPLGHPMHHEDDGYVDALRRNAYNNQGGGVGMGMDSYVHLEVSLESVSVFS
jgi:hypothetical protein